MKQYSLLHPKMDEAKIATQPVVPPWTVTARSNHPAVVACMGGQIAHAETGIRKVMRILGAAVLIYVAQTACAADFARSRYVDTWLRHPVYGDPSFDAFERVPGNPIHRGAPPFEWPVNGFLFQDPVSGHHYIYVGDYTLGYGGRPSRCVLYRSTDGARSWSNLGVVLHGDPALFDKNGHTPDVSVVYDNGRYHMVYDWGELDFNAEGGLAYAWAEKPEGPWHRAPQPITRNTTLPKLLGRYQRTYAATLIRRAHDWLIVAMMDAAPNAWALFTMTAPRPEGPWSERQLVRHVERDEFHPPLMEFFPSFAHKGILYVPATSVALNRNFNLLFQVPLERATEPDAWKIAQHGSLWHSEDVENESYGLWGQTFSGSVDAGGILRAMFNSRDARGMGTVNLARRSWKQPLRDRGFVLTGHQGPSFTCLRQTFRQFSLAATLRLRGTAWLIWDYHGALGPNLPQSDATLHPLAKTRFQAVQLSPAGWQVIRMDETGRATTQASGAVTNLPTWRINLERKRDGTMALRSDGNELWTSLPDARVAEDDPGAVGLWVEPHTHLFVDEFQIAGQPLPAKLNYLGLEALLGAGENLANWQERSGPKFRYGIGLVAKQPQARVKWNVTGKRLTLWSPRGPEFGEAEIRVDGERATVVNLYAEKSEPSQPVWTSKQLRGAFHGVVWESVKGLLPVDCLQVED